MVSTLKNFMADNDFSPELGDKAYCLIDADADAVKNAQLEKAERLAERFNIQIIVGKRFRLIFPSMQVDSLLKHIITVFPFVIISSVQG